MQTITIFNNKGGVGKTTLTYHTAHALAELGHKTLIMDLDPQCNVTILAMQEENLHDIWEKEEDFISDYKSARDGKTESEYKALFDETRSIHFLLKPAQDGVDSTNLAKPYSLGSNIDIIPGRLTTHLFEEKISNVWSDVYKGDPHAIRIVTEVRRIAIEYAELYGYEYVIIDTSPSLGALNKTIISVTDGFLIPAMPDLFSVYGIKNIGNALKSWQKEFNLISQFLPAEKRDKFPSKFVRLAGYTIYNARKRENPGKWDLTVAHYNYAKQIPDTIRDYIDSSIWSPIGEELLKNPIGGQAVMHTHNTLPNMAQKYHVPMWNVPNCALEKEDISTINGLRTRYEDTKDKYKEFAEDMIGRLNILNSTRE
jgi:cellulose biosynthesis protein BcsQ